MSIAGTMYVCCHLVLPSPSTAAIGAAGWNSNAVSRRPVPSSLTMSLSPTPFTCGVPLIASSNVMSTSRLAPAPAAVISASVARRVPPVVSTPTWLDAATIIGAVVSTVKPSEAGWPVMPMSLLSVVAGQPNMSRPDMDHSILSVPSAWPAGIVAVAR